MTARLLKRITYLSFPVIVCILIAAWWLRPSSELSASTVDPIVETSEVLASEAQARGQDIEDATSSEDVNQASIEVDGPLPLDFILWGAILSLIGLASYILVFRMLHQKSKLNRGIFLESPAPLVVTDMRWKIRDANNAFSDLVGISGKQLRGQPLSEYVSSDKELHAPDIQEKLHREKKYAFTVEVKKGKDDRTDMAVSTRYVKYAKKPLLVTAFHDISEQLGEHRLFKTFHRSLVENLPLEVSVLAPQGQYLYINPKAIPDAEIRSEVLGNSDVEYCKKMGYHPEMALRRRSHRRHAVQTKTTVSFEETTPDSEGGYRYVTRIYSPVINKSGTVTAVVDYGVETTELKRYHDQMEEVRAEAERVSEMKETFLANISHEFRTPLTGILGFAQLLQEEVNPKDKEFVDIIIRNGRRLMATLNAMLDLSRVHSNYLQMTPSVFNLVDEVKEVAQSLSSLANEKELYLRLRATRPEVLVRLDRANLFRVLENLIGNAIKFTSSGGVIVEVSGDLAHVYIRVMDSGVGIRNEFLPFLFEEFNQESKGSTREYEGAGIGLAIVKRILDLMNGEISVDSEKGQGSTFTLKFPTAFPQIKNGSPERSRVLVADTSEEVHTLIQYVLSPYFDVEYAPDYASAVLRARETRFDVVLLDAELGDAGSAEEALAPFRGMMGMDEVPVVALDPHAQHGGEVHYLAVGYADYLQKPLDKQVLLNSLGQVLSGERNPRL